MGGSKGGRSASRPLTLLSAEPVPPLQPWPRNSHFGRRRLGHSAPRPDRFGYVIDGAVLQRRGEMTVLVELLEAITSA